MWHACRRCGAETDVEQEAQREETIDVENLCLRCSAQQQWASKVFEPGEVLLSHIRRFQVDCYLHVTQHEPVFVCPESLISIE